MPENSFDLPPLPQRPQAERPESPTASRRAILTLGAIAGAAIFLVPRRNAQALGTSQRGDLRFLTQLSILQSEFFYSAALANSTERFSEREASAINLIAKQDNEQARWFQAARDLYQPGTFEQPSKLNLSSSKPITSYRIPANNFTTRDPFYKEAIRLKETSVGVMHEFVGLGGDSDLVQAIASIAGVQNRHLAMLLELSGAEPFTPFVPAVTFGTAGRRLAAYKFDPEAL